MSGRIKITCDNYRVEVDVRVPWLWDPNKPNAHGRMVDDANEIIADIKRHVDNVGGMRVQWDTTRECASCGSRWTEESDIFNGGCCDEDMKHEPPQAEVNA